MRRWILAVLLTGSLAGRAWSQVPNVGLPPVPGAPTPPPSSTATPPPGTGGSQAPSPYPARMSIIDPKGVEVRSGPSSQFYPTTRLRYGEVVTVVKDSTEPGWYVIIPPAGSFSWIEGKYVRTIPGDPRMGVVDAENNAAAPVLPGSSIVNQEPNRQSIEVASGFVLTILENPMEVNGKKWYRILPPPTDVRFIPKDAIQAPQTATVSPTNWARPNGSAPATSSQAPWGNNQLASNTSGQTAGTPASFTQPANQWTQYNGVATQPPQWSAWGKLRKTAFDNNGQPMYVLEDRQGRPVLYVNTPPGLSLNSYLNRDVSLYGSISYRSDGYQRTYYITATHVATP